MSENVRPLRPIGSSQESDNALFRELAEQSADILALGDVSGRIRYASPATKRLLGRSPPDLVGRRLAAWVHRLDVAKLGAMQQRAQASGPREAVMELRLRHRDGRWLWMEARIRWLIQTGGDRWEWVASLRDITERRRFEQHLAAEKDRAQATLRAIADGVVSVGAEAHVEYLNPAAERILGWSAPDAMGKHAWDVFHLAGQRPPPADAGIAGMAAWLHAASEGPVPVIRRDGSECTVQLSVATIADGEGRPRGLVLTFRDTSQTAALVRELAYRASHDSLTGLRNREEFERQLKRLVADANTGGGPHAVCYIDLDQFKLVNDTCGHAAGDALLKDVAQALADLLPEAGMLARLGGDEFGILLPHCPVGEAARLAQSMVDALAHLRFEWGDRQFSIGGSIGVAPLNTKEVSQEQVLMAADAACYVAKERGRNRVHVFEPSDVDVVKRQGEMRWIPRLQTALEVGDFHLLALDIIPCATGVPTGRHIEVLISLPDASGRLVPPGEFLPAAQHYGLMGRIDRWVIGQVCEWLQWREHTGRVLPELVAVNLSGSSLSDPEFRDYAEECVRALPPDASLCFELTESEAIANLGEAGEFIRRMREFGCAFALDDFGAGLNSFAYLKRLPVDYIKIDGQFVRDADDDGVSLAMVESIHRIGKVLGVRTIAEFVESEAVYRRVKDIGVDFCQGYYFGQPRPLLSLD